MMALLFASGRRSAELLPGGACFKPSDNEELYECYVITWIKGGLLVPFSVFRNGQERFRTKWGHLSQITNRMALTERARAIMAPHLKTEDERKRFKARDFRALYARYSVAIFGKGLNINAWIQSVLMHQSVATSLNYTRINFPGDNIERMQKMRIFDKERIGPDFRCSYNRLAKIRLNA